MKGWVPRNGRGVGGVLRQLWAAQSAAVTQGTESPTGLRSGGSQGASRSGPRICIPRVPPGPTGAGLGVAGFAQPMVPHLDGLKTTAHLTTEVFGRC